MRLHALPVHLYAHPAHLCWRDLLLQDAPVPRLSHGTFFSAGVADWGVHNIRAKIAAIWAFPSYDERGKVEPLWRRNLSYSAFLTPC